MYFYLFLNSFLKKNLELYIYKLIKPTNAIWHILSPNLMLLYGSSMRDVGLKWRNLLFWYILFCFWVLSYSNKFWFEICFKLNIKVFFPSSYYIGVVFFFFVFNIIITNDENDKQISTFSCTKFALNSSLIKFEFEFELTLSTIQMKFEFHSMLLNWIELNMNWIVFGLK
jgi:hypothetical protein